MGGALSCEMRDGRGKHKLENLEFSFVLAAVYCKLHNKQNMIQEEPKWDCKPADIY